MKSQLVTALSIFGVLATAGGAMAVNSDALSTFMPGVVGQASTVLVPNDSAGAADLMSPESSTAPDGLPTDPAGAADGAPSVVGVDPALAPATPAADNSTEKAPVSGNSGGSPVYTGDDDEDEDENEDEDEDDEEEDDEDEDSESDD